MSLIWKPNVTVAAVVARAGRYLMVEERTSAGVRYNQPAGHLESGESLIAAVIRETLEETARSLVPEGLLGVYMARADKDGEEVTYLRFAFCGTVGDAIADRALDAGIVRALWLDYDEIVALRELHRSPLVLRCVEDHRAGREPVALDLLHCDASVGVSG